MQKEVSGLNEEEAGQDQPGRGRPIKQTWRSTMQNWPSTRNMPAKEVKKHRRTYRKAEYAEEMKGHLNEYRRMENLQSEVKTGGRISPDR